MVKVSKSWLWYAAGVALPLCGAASYRMETTALDEALDQRLRGQVDALLAEANGLRPGDTLSDAICIPQDMSYQLFRDEPPAIRQLASVPDPGSRPLDEVAVRQAERSGLSLTSEQDGFRVLTVPLIESETQRPSGLVVQVAAPTAAKRQAGRRLLGLWLLGSAMTLLTLLWARSD